MLDVPRRTHRGFDRLPCFGILTHRLHTQQKQIKTVPLRQQREERQARLPLAERPLPTPRQQRLHQLPGALHVYMCVGFNVFDVPGATVLCDLCSACL